jgi:hypothetical protein
MSYLAAIRQECLLCMNDQPGLVRACQSQSCPLHPYRFGTGNPNAKLTPLRTIRAKCVDCLGGSTAEPKRCSHAPCPLFPYRTGHNPKLQGKGKGQVNAGRFPATVQQPI